MWPIIRFRNGFPNVGNLIEHWIYRILLCTKFSTLVLNFQLSSLNFQLSMSEHVRIVSDSQFKISHHSISTAVAELDLVCSHPPQQGVQTCFFAELFSILSSCLFWLAEPWAVSGQNWTLTVAISEQISEGNARGICWVKLNDVWFIGILCMCLNDPNQLRLLQNGGLGDAVIHF